MPRPPGMKYFLPLGDEPLAAASRLSPRDASLYKQSGMRDFPGYGFACGIPMAPKPLHNLGTGEKMITGPSNASIKIGVDRDGGLASGLGGAGIPAAAIDIVAGHMGPYATEIVQETGEQVACNPNFQVDSARIYISEQCESIDEFMKIPDGNIGGRRGTSAIGIIAEDVNIQSKGEGGIKIAAVSTNRNSRNQKNLSNPGIDLIAGDGIDQQPLVKGNNLLELLKNQSEQIDELRGNLEQFVRIQGNFNDKAMNHNHMSPFNALSTAPSHNLLFEGFKQMFQRVADVEKGMIFSIVNKEMSTNNYFNPVAEKYILSSLVTTS